MRGFGGVPARDTALRPIPRSRVLQHAVQNPASLRTLIIDNYDSYTYNIYQIWARINGVPPTVIKNDQLSWHELRHDLLLQPRYDNVIISPGPGHPAHPEDVGVCLDVLREAVDVPLLGVCMGHQALGHLHGAAVTHAPRPVHGQAHSVYHDGDPLFAGVPGGGFDAVRYHSLVVNAASLPPCLLPIAWTVDEASPDRGGAAPPVKLLMALKHAHRPHYGVQFHPESIGSSHGVTLLRNFHTLSCEALGRPSLPPPPSPPPPTPAKRLAVGSSSIVLPASVPPPAGEAPGAPAAPAAWPDADHGEAAPLRLLWRRLPGALTAAGGSAAIFRALHTDSTDQGGATPSGAASAGGADRMGYSSAPSPTAEAAPPHAGCRPNVSPESDASASAERGDAHDALGMSGAQAEGDPGSSTSISRRASSFEAPVTPDEDTFWLDSSSTDRARFSFLGGRGGPLWRRISHRLPPPGSGATPCTTLRDAQGAETVLQGGFFDFLDTFLQQHRVFVEPDTAAALPFDFWGGLVGYLGYELKSECGGSARWSASTPDALLFAADRVVAVDHATDDVYLLALHDRSTGGEAAAATYVEDTALLLERLSRSHQTSGTSCAGQREKRGAVTPAGASGTANKGESAGSGCELRRSREQYLEDIDACQVALRDGESYEICLTNAYEGPAEGLDAWRLYNTLRTYNAAPYSSWLSFEGGPTVCCCSPERFLQGGRGGLLQARPIKGTAPRFPDDPAEDAASAERLLASDKDRSENLMIVDLLRNDLGAVCLPGSVHVPDLMQLESFASVHQLVSTVEGVRRPGVSVGDCLRATFPGGSMTGAPKMRTLSIIDDLEGCGRGVYSGSIGMLGFNDTFDLNIVIRTAVFWEGQLTVGAGGAITIQSDADSEFEEMELKARALLSAVQQCRSAP